MKRRFALGLISIGAAVLIAVPWLPLMAQTPEAPAPPVCGQEELYCPSYAAAELEKLLETFPAPSLAGPPAAVVTPPITVSKPVTKTVTYVVATEGTVTADFAAFRQLAYETLNDSKGWKRLGVKFEEVPTGGEFTLVLSQASKVPGFGWPCDATYSCRVGRYVVINEDRWQNATTPWNDAGGSLRDYRHMVVNHETGHWLGHGHNSCSGVGHPAAVMQQQSISLQGCKFNPWPLDSEIWSSTLGI